MGDLKRTGSLISLPSISYDRYGDVYYRTKDTSAYSYSLRRSTSVPDIYGVPHWSPKGSPYKLYYPDTHSYSDPVWEPRYYSRPIFYPQTAWSNRRYRGLEPPWHQWFNYPSLSYTARYSRYNTHDLVDPFYWRRFRDPYYQRPVWYPYRPWYYESVANQRAADMCRRGTINFETYNKYWLTPFYSERKHYYDFGAFAPPSWSKSPRRYYFSYDAL